MSAQEKLFPRDPGRSYPVLVRGEGVHVWDENGRRYLDATSGIAVSSFGHANETLARALYDQAMRLDFQTSMYYVNDRAIEMAELVSEITPGDLNHLYPTSGGSESVETAIKIARQYHMITGNANKTIVIGRWQSYHGNTFGALAASGLTSRRAPYTPYLPAFPHISAAYCYRCPHGCSYPSCELACAKELERLILETGPDYVSAFIAEPIVGAAGAAMAPPPGYYEEIRAICDKYNVLFIADEVITGFGRTGKYFGIQHWDVLPDMMAVAKGMGAGLAPIGGVITSKRIYDAFIDTKTPCINSYTFGGSPIPAAAAIAAIRMLRDGNWPEKVAQKGEYFFKKMQRLYEIPIVGDIRGKGLLAGIELVADQKSKTPFPREQKTSDRLFWLGLDRGVLTYPGGGAWKSVLGDHVLLCPPFTITESQIDELVDMLESTLRTLAAEKGK